MHRIYFWTSYINKMYNLSIFLFRKLKNKNKMKGQVTYMDSFMRWMGGKKLLRKRICEEINKSNYKTYIEVFGGAGWVLFNEERKRKNRNI